MSGLYTETVQLAHAYTRSDVPWELGEDREAFGMTTASRKFGWRLFRYIASGGMRTFGRTVAQMERARRQRRFAAFAAAFAIFWSILYFT